MPCYGYRVLMWNFPVEVSWVFPYLHRLVCCVVFDNASGKDISSCARERRAGGRAAQCCGLG